MVSAIALTLLSALPLFSAGRTEPSTQELSIAVFVPGVVSGSPVYEMLVAGAQNAVNEAITAGTKVSLTVIEAGTRQADWGTKMVSTAAEGGYSLIITSNPAMPEIIEPITLLFPKQDFLVFDAKHEGNPAITTFRYNQREQAYISGYMAALVSSSSMTHANKAKKIGLIAGQEYPAMTEIILPAYTEGARAVDPSFEIDFRVVGNWYDASRGSDLARAMQNAGCDVIMPISGGANQGVIAAAKELSFYIAWFDDNGYGKAPSLVISSAIMAQEKLVHEQVAAYINGTLKKGVHTTVGMTDGYIAFVSEDERYIETVPLALRQQMKAMLARIADGSLALPSR